MKTIQSGIFIFLLTIMFSHSLTAAQLKLSLTGGWGVFQLPPHDPLVFASGSSLILGGPQGHLGIGYLFGDQKVRPGLGLSVNAESWLSYRSGTASQNEWAAPAYLLGILEFGLLSLQAGAGPGLFFRQIQASSGTALRETLPVPGFFVSAALEFRLGKNLRLPIGLRADGLLVPGASSFFSPNLRIVFAPFAGLALVL